MEIVRVYELNPDFECTDILVTALPSDGHVYDLFDGREMASGWRTIPVESSDESGGDPSVGDYSLLGTVPVFSLRALEALLHILRKNGEVLPLRYAGEEYFAYNVTRFGDVLDEENSVLKRLPSGRILTISRHAFRPVDDLTIFKIPQFPKAHVYVTEPFVENVRSAGLTGFAFRLLTE